MAKNMFPMKTGGNLLNKIIGTVIVLSVLALVIEHPADAAHAVTGLFRTIDHVIDGVSDFLRKLSA
jgi:hypothetical protein